MARKPIPFCADGHMGWDVPRWERKRFPDWREAKPFQARLRFQESYERGYVFLDDADKRYYVEAHRLGNMINRFSNGVIEGTFDYVNVAGRYFSIRLMDEDIG